VPIRPQNDMSVEKNSSQKQIIFMKIITKFQDNCDRFEQWIIFEIFKWNLWTSLSRIDHQTWLIAIEKIAMISEIFLDPSIIRLKVFRRGSKWQTRSERGISREQRE